MDFRKKSYVQNPVETANPLSKLFFWWLVPLLRNGRKKEFLQDKLYNAPKEDTAEKLGNQLAVAWETEIAKSKIQGNRPKLWRALIVVHRKNFIVCAVFLSLTELCLRPLQALSLKWLLQTYSEAPPKENAELMQYLYAGGICLTAFLDLIIAHPSVFGFDHIGMQMRIASSSLIYRKVLQIRTNSETQVSVGQLINLVSNDVSRFDLNLYLLHFFYIGPLQTAIFVYLLWEEFGPSCMAGAGIIIFLTPFQYFVGKMFATFRIQIAKWIDERGRIMNEILVAMRIIKMYGWEKPFGELICHIRSMEVNILRKSAYLRAFYLSIYLSSGKIITFVTFITYVYVDEKHVLTADKVFFAVISYELVRVVTLSFLPNAAAAAGELIVAMNRIESFLLTNEQNVTDNTRLLMSSGVGYNDNTITKPLVKLENACASWTAENVTLDKCDLLLEGDKIVIVCGSVGSGKTSLLHALLGELPVTSGKCVVQGSTTYASQKAWLMSGSVRQNILFGREYDDNRYHEIIEVCALKDDLKQLPWGDNTLVGDHGATLSGGQKARINMARALYGTADIYLLDDPLSAVDSLVSRHIFEKCIKRHLKGSLRILVTHQIQYLSQADHIVVFSEGKIVAQGTYEELQRKGSDFITFLSSGMEEGGGKRKESNTRPDARNSISVHEPEVNTIKPEEHIEETAGGSASGKVCWNYFRAGNSLVGILFLISGFILTQTLFSASEFWLSIWTSEEDQNSGHTDGAFSNLSRDVYIYVYTGITIAIILVTKAKSFHFFAYCVKISINIHNKMFSSISRSPTKFFDDNPSGRILNRFTKDLGSIDELLPPAFFDAFYIFLKVIGTVVVIVITNYYMILPTVVVMILFGFIRQFYIKTALEVKRMESIARSPLLTHLAASLEGLTTIRSLKSETRLTHQFEGLQDDHSAAYYIFISCNRWFAIWLELTVVVFLVAVLVGFLLANGTSGELGLAISSALAITGSLQWGMRRSAEAENLMTSVERALEYSKLKPEAALESPPDKKAGNDWPTKGVIEFRDVSLAYEKEKPVLKNLNFVIKGQEKIGIVGRTGAGKSSIIAALFRLTEPSGDILIDGIAINGIGLHDLRKKISIIPQDPVLFMGTIRYNLDPFDQFRDEQLWEVIGETNLKDKIPALDFKVLDGGTNFSVGERQLVCLARAILLKNKIIVLDEATANVDHGTDNLIQQTIRQKFVACTMITIAHRLHSVLDCDRIIVLDNGCLKEFDHPHVLLQNPNGILTSMVGQAGSAGSATLQRIAHKKYFRKNSANIRGRDSDGQSSNLESSDVEK